MPLLYINMCTNEAPRGPGRDRSAIAKAFETVLVDELVPYIDAIFNTIAKRESRAMAGLSMGGMETKAITLARPAVFSYHGLLSGGTYAYKTSDYSYRFAVSSKNKRKHKKTTPRSGTMNNSG